MGSMRFQPQAISRLNLAHPLTRGLAFAWSAGAPDINLINGRPAVSKGTPPARGPVPGSATGRIFANNGSIDFGNTAETNFGGQSQQTILALVYVPNTGSGDGYICGRVQGSWDYYLNISSGGQQVSYATGGNSSGITWPSSSYAGGLQPIQGRTVPIVGTYDKTTSKIYIDGLLKNSRSETGSFSTGGDSFGIGARGGGGQSSAGGFSTSLILIFKRTLSDAEVLSLSQNPWQIFDDVLDEEDESVKVAGPAAASLTGTAAAIATAYGALTTAIPFSGSAVGQAIAAASMIAPVALSGATQGQATTAGALTVSSGNNSNAGGPAGSLGMTVQSSGTSSYNLSALGGIDWIVYNSSTPVRKNGGGGLISVGHVGSFSDSLATDSKETSTWSDGAGTTSGSTNDLIFSSAGDGIGYSVTFPADTTPRIAYVIGGVYSTRLRITASLSDGSAPSVVDTSISSDSSGGNPALTTIQYQAASAGQTLTVTLVQIAPSGYANTSFQAAALALGTIAAALAGSAQGIASPAATLTTAIPLAGSAAGRASGAASMTAPVTLAGSTQAKANGAATLTTAIALAGAASGVVTSAATLSTAISFAGTAQGTASGAASLAIVSGGLSGATQGQASGAANLTTAIAFSGAAQGQASGAAALSTGGSIAGSASGQATGSANLTTAIAISGAAIGQAQGAASLGSAAAALSGTTSGKASGGAQLSVAISLAGAQQAQASGKAALSTQIALVAIAQARASANATLSTGISFVGAAFGSSSPGPTVLDFGVPVAVNAARTYTAVRRVRAYVAQERIREL